MNSYTLRALFLHRQVSELYHSTRQWLPGLLRGLRFYENACLGRVNSYFTYPARLFSMDMFFYVVLRTRLLFLSYDIIKSMQHCTLSAFETINPVKTIKPTFMSVYAGTYW